ncbi:MAG: DegV family protein [Butyrivibrio sp.]|nr:DegV family protein [Butyrivibrio sp.]
MMRIAIMTDENSGIPMEEARARGIFMMKMPFFVNGELRFHGKDMTFEQFYQYLDEGAEVSTSQPSPGDVIDMWNKILADGYDEIVYIPMSSGLSESCNSAKVFAEEFDGKVHVVDNHRISITMEQSVYDAVIYAEQGMSAKEIKERLEKEAYDASIYIAVDTLSYIKKGGRVTAAAAAIGTVLNLKPVLTIQGEKLDAYAKERGMKKARHVMIDAMKKDLEKRFAELDESGEYKISISYSHVDDETLQSWIDEVREAFPGRSIGARPLSLSIACHIGPGALAVAGFRRAK